MADRKRNQLTQKAISSKIDVDLYRQVKVASVMKDKNLSEVIADALRLWLKTVTSEGSPAGA